MNTMTKEQWTILASYLNRKEFLLLTEAMASRERGHLASLQNVDPANAVRVAHFQALSKNLVSTLRGIKEEADQALQD